MLVLCKYDDITVETVSAKPTEEKCVKCVVYGKLVDGGKESGFIRILCEEELRDSKDDKREVVFVIPVGCVIEMFNLKIGKKMERI